MGFPNIYLMEKDYSFPRDISHLRACRLYVKIDRTDNGNVGFVGYILGKIVNPSHRSSIAH